MAAYEYDDFWVEFSPRAGGGYSVAARAPDGETSKGSFQLPFTNEQLEAAVRTLGYTRAATTRDIGEVTTERRLTAEQLGGELADALLVGPTGDLYSQARSAAIAKGRGVRLWLSLGKAPGLLSVPWEFLYLQPTFLASQRKTPIVRFLSTHAPVAPRRIEDTVRILGVVASPDGLPKLEVAQERKRVDDALSKARQEREVTIDWLDPATPKAAPARAPAGRISHPPLRRSQRLRRRERRRARRRGRGCALPRERGSQRRAGLRCPAGQPARRPGFAASRRPQLV